MMLCNSRAWVVVACNFFAQMLTHGLSTSMGVFYVQWKANFPDEAVMISLLASSVLAMLLGTSPFTGAVTRHCGIHAVMVAGALLSASGFLVASFTQNVAVLFVTIACMTGIGNSLAYSGCILSVAEHFKKNYAFFNGIASTGCGMGMILLPLLCQALVDLYTWRGALMIVAGLQLHIIPLAIVLTWSKQKKTQGSTEVKEGDGQTNRDSRDKTDDWMMATDSEDVGNVSHEQSNTNFDECIHADRSKENHDDQQEQETFYSEKMNGNVERDLIKRGSPCSRSNSCAVLHPNNSVSMELEADTNDANEDVKAFLSRRMSRRATIIAKTVQTSMIDSTGLSLLWTNCVFCCCLPIPLLAGAVFGTVLVHIAAVAISHGTPPLEAAFLISVIGIANIISRGTHGYILETGIIHPMIFYALSLFFAALSTILIPIVHNYVLMVACAAGVGLAAGVYIPILQVLIRHMVGMHRFPGAFGMGLFAVCIGNMSSALMSGYIFDQTGNYPLAFSFAGVSVFLGGILIIIEHILWNYYIMDERWPPKMKRKKKNLQTI